MNRGTPKGPAAGEARNEKLRRRLAELSARVAELEETLSAIRTGAVDAIVGGIPGGERIYTLSGADAAYRVLFEAMGEGALTVTPKGLVLYANRRLSEIVGRPLETIIGGDLFSLVVPERRQDLEAMLKEASGTPEAEILLRTGSRTAVPTVLSCTRLPGSDPPALGIVVSDLSARKRREEELQTAKEALEREILARKAAEAEVVKGQKLEAVGILAAGIAHDFNNALTAIINFMRVARLSARPGELPHDKLEAAEQAAQNARGLTQQLLTFAKGGAPVKTTIAVGRILRDTASFAVRGSKVRCEFSIPPDLWPVDADPGQISQVISNVVINADQSMEDGGIVDVAADNIVVSPEDGLPLEAGRYVRISVADRGCGIPDDVLPKIFDPYFSTKAGGSGLGLSSCYTIVRKHDGHIRATPREGRGTVFAIYLPASQAQPAIDSAKGKAPRADGARILFMEDDALVADAVSLGLRILGIQVDWAEEGGQAVGMYRQALSEGNPYDVVVVDLTIPGGMGGEQTIRRLREEDANVRAIVASGYSEVPIMANFRDYGFRGVLPKPYNLDQLVEVIHNVIRES